MAEQRMDTNEPMQTPESEQEKRERESGEEAGLLREVRATDIEPYTGLRYLSKLFRFMAVILLLLLVAEIVTGLTTQGAASVPTLLGEASRLIVLAGVLWGTGDLALLLVDIGHDVRAARILLARQTHHQLRDVLPKPGAEATRPVIADAPPPPPPGLTMP